MRSVFPVFVTVLFCLIFCLTAAEEAIKYFSDKCTTIVVGPAAGIGGPMTTHTADCADCDFRLNKVPARDHPEGSMRALYEYTGKIL